MIPRYTRPEMAEIWSDEARFEHMLRVEIASLHALSQAGIVPAEAVAAIEERGRVDDQDASLRPALPHGSSVPYDDRRHVGAGPTHSFAHAPELVTVPRWESWSGTIHPSTGASIRPVP